MAQLAIKGHSKRGKEVIEILEMLGGENVYKLNGCNIECAYYKKNGVIYNTSPVGLNNIKLLTLEEFLEKFPYKVGGKVQHKGATSCGSVFEVEKMRWVDDHVEYAVKRLWYWNDHYTFTAEDLQPFEEETMEIMEEGVYAYNEINCYHRDFADKVQIRLGGDYKIEVEEGKTYIVRKKPQYPMSYLECCRIIVAKHDRHYYYTKKDKEQDYPNEIRILDQLDHLRMLIICRDAYWKIAGEQMGWGKPWEPDWKSAIQYKYCLYTDSGGIKKDYWHFRNSILAFPTKEMRDAFYENFKDLIEACKEFL